VILKYDNLTWVYSCSVYADANDKNKNLLLGYIMVLDLARRNYLNKKIVNYTFAKKNYQLIQNALLKIQ